MPVRVALQRGIHGRPGYGEQLGEVSDGVIAGGVHAPQLGLLFRGKLGLLAAQLALGASDGHALLRWRPSTAYSIERVVTIIITADASDRPGGSGTCSPPVDGVRRRSFVAQVVRDQATIRDFLSQSDPARRRWSSG